MAIFAPKKKDDWKTQTAMSTFSSLLPKAPQVSSKPQQSVYQNMSVAPKQTTQKQPVKITTNPTQRLTDFFKAGTTLPQAPKMPSFRKPQMSQVNQSYNNKPLIQGSGMSRMYASNPTNYKPPVPKPTPRVDLPQTDPTQSYLDYASGVANRQKSFAEQQRDQELDFIRQQYGLANEQLRGQLPVAEEQFNRLKGDTEAMIADLIAGGERQKTQTEDYYGDAQRQAAQTRRETQGQTQRTFANLGTLDSRGEGSFQQATENADSEFNRFTQQTLRAKADKLSEIDAAVRAGERQARQTIADEQAKLNELARGIEYAVANNNLQQARELTAAYNQTQQYIYDIEDSVAQTKYQFALAQQELDNELAKIQSFTPEFMATGNPTNQAEYEFLIKNQDVMNNLYNMDSGSSSKQKATNIIDELLGMDTQGISGRMRYAFSDEARAAEGLLKQLSSELQLEEAARLKGQGSMSDSERAILANSIAAFNLDENGRPQVSDERFRQILDQLRAGFSGQPSLASILG